MDQKSLLAKNKQNISDGYHTFGELYEHRHALFIALANSHPDLAWKSIKHNDGTMFPGYFIAGMALPEQITYHLPLVLWKRLRVKILRLAPEWDGHTSRDVVDRLNRWNVP